MRTITTLMLTVFLTACASCDSEPGADTEFGAKVLSVEFDMTPNGDPIQGIPSDPYAAFKVIWRINGSGMGYVIDAKTIMVPSLGTGTVTECFAIEARDWTWVEDHQSMPYGSTLTGEFVAAKVEGADIDPEGFAIITVDNGVGRLFSREYLENHSPGGTILKRGAGVAYKVESLPEGVRITVDGKELPLFRHP